ncbi:MULTISPECIES: FadR/GntR family transcriptional regulator [Falsihalocynthiibacter]|uniref:FadR/GntR family transcriptional regulator n=1 Tax=Falsihalocynthiibacter TaxID=2854182 RepID=UPI003001E009
MPFQKIQSEKLAQSVVSQIERLILRGILRPGERLPSERELSDRMGVSRPSLREAISELQNAGLLTSKAGAGIYVSEALGSAFSSALVSLFGRHDDAFFDYVSFRRDMEGLAAERAAQTGSDIDLEVIDQLFAKMEAAHAKRNPTEEAALDAEFHLSIIEASHNTVMLHMMRAMYELLREGVFYNRQIMFKQRTTRDTLLEQHRDINTAIQTRDPVAAKAATLAHLDFVERSLFEKEKADKNEAIAKQRLEQELRR